MEQSRKYIRKKLKSYADLQISLSKLDPVKEQSKYQQCINQIKEIMTMINAIPVGTREYNVIRLKYIEQKSWARVEREMFLSERACRLAASKGLDMIAALYFSGE